MSTEQDPLLPGGGFPHVQRNDGLDRHSNDSSIRHTPLVAFLATFGMNAAAASSVFVFAHILCKNPTSCDSNEQYAFSRLLAIATTIANVCAILVIQPLHAISKRKPKTVLLLWLACRGCSIGLLWFAASFKSVSIALLSKVLEGTATDNILQFALSTIYTRAKDSKELSTLMAESMAFTLLGSSLGPVAAGLCPDFRSRILVAVGTLAVGAAYVCLASKVPTRKNEGRHSSAGENTASRSGSSQSATIPSRMVRGLFSHLAILSSEPTFLYANFTLMLYTIGQAYVLPAIMVYASGHYGFTDRQNSWLLSLVTAVSASFIFAVRFAQRKIWGMASDATHNLAVALVGMVALAVSLPLVMKTKESGQMYLVASSMSLGLSSSSFIKTYGLLPLQHPEEGTAALAIFETVGSFLSPLILGAAQTNLSPGRWTFVSTGMIAVATVVLFAAHLMGYVAKVRDQP